MAIHTCNVTKTIIVSQSPAGAFNLDTCAFCDTLQGHTGYDVSVLSFEYTILLYAILAGEDGNARKLFQREKNAATNKIL